MSGMDVAYRSEVGDSVGALDVLKEICDGKTPKDSSRASNPQETAKERIP
jgi:hypothetical protein